jgi:putative Holliday junction resolvase
MTKARPPMGKLLCVDHGLKRLGVAVCDASQLIARELIVITRKSKQEDFAKLSEIIQQQNVVAVVVGLPYNESVSADGYSQADKVKTWVERWQEVMTLPVIFWDEQLTSEDAKVLAKQQRRKPDAPIDDLAARIILQSYLDALRDGLS